MERLGCAKPVSFWPREIVVCPLLFHGLSPVVSTSTRAWNWAATKRSSRPSSPASASPPCPATPSRSISPTSSPCWMWWAFRSCATGTPSIRPGGNCRWWRAFLDYLWGGGRRRLRWRAKGENELERIQRLIASKNGAIRLCKARFLLAT